MILGLLCSMAVTIVCVSVLVYNNVVNTRCAGECITITNRDFYQFFEPLTMRIKTYVRRM